jgi:hypothetical protein
MRLAARSFDSPRWNTEKENIANVPADSSVDVPRIRPFHEGIPDEFCGVKKLDADDGLAVGAN